MYFYSIILLLLFKSIILVNGQNHLCERVEIIFIVDSSSATNSSYYENDIKSFVKTISSSFSFKDDVEQGSNSHARFAVGSYGDTYHYKFKYLRDETRKSWNDIVDQHFVYTNFGDGAAYNGMGLSEQILKTSSVDMNRVVILLTSIVTEKDVNHASTRYVHDMSPVVFGIGFPDINGINNVAKDNKLMIEMAQNHSEWVYNTLNDALKPKTGIVSQIVKNYPCSDIQCTGYIFAMEDTYQTNSSMKSYMNTLIKVINQLPTKSNGFQFLSFDDSQVDLFPFETTSGIIDRINNYWFEPVFSPTASKLDLLLADINSVIDKKEFEKFSVVILAETDYIQNEFLTDIAAKILSKSSAEVFVVDVSVNPKDDGKIFDMITKNQKDHIIKAAGLDEDGLYQEMNKKLIPTLTQLKC